MPASRMGPLGKEGLPWKKVQRGRSVSRLNVLIGITAAIIGLIYGYDLGSIASALLFLVPAFKLSTFMTSAVVLGQLFGALFAGRISNAIGRKRSLVLVALGYATFAGLQGLAPNGGPDISLLKDQDQLLHRARCRLV